MTDLGSWPAWGSRVAWTVGTLAASWGIGYLLGAFVASRVPRWLPARQQSLAASAGGVAEFEPFIRYHTFADSSVSFTVILRAREFVDQHLVKHEFIKRLHARFSQEGIVIPSRFAQSRGEKSQLARWPPMSGPDARSRSGCSIFPVSPF